MTGVNLPSQTCFPKYYFPTSYERTRLIGDPDMNAEKDNLGSVPTTLEPDDSQTSAPYDDSILGLTASILRNGTSISDTSTTSEDSSLTSDSASIHSSLELDNKSSPGSTMVRMPNIRGTIKDNADILIRTQGFTNASLTHQSPLAMPSMPLSHPLITRTILRKTLDWTRFYLHPLEYCIPVDVVLPGDGLLWPQEISVRNVTWHSFL
jgi:hypothetical protein